MLLCLFLIDGSSGLRYGIWVELLGLPNEVLQQIAIILGQK